MAQRILIQIVDDLDGREIAEGKGETLAFALDGSSYEIDLSQKNAEAFRGLFEEYIAVARKVGRKSGTPGKRNAIGPAASEIRDWGRSNGFTVPARGRIPSEIRDAFEAAH